MVKNKINYFKNWDQNGTCYNQNIKISYDLAVKFNKYVDEVIKEVNEDIKKNHLINSYQTDVIYYLDKIKLDGITYSHLNTLHQFIYFYKRYIMKDQNDPFFKRILNRNTTFSVIGG